MNGKGLIKEHALSILYTIYQENIEIFLLGPKPPGPNRERAETSWGRTGKGPKPLAFLSSACATETGYFHRPYEPLGSGKI